ncbi:ABC transporter ATP-binding protein [Rothia koreensis]|uniref:ABC transporter ATP-binding protein n=1 Tax=Rothia koreensis TaxID=592378 RepID=UPI003FCE1C41
MTIDLHAEPSSVRFTNITKRYKTGRGSVTAVEGFNLSIEPGELVSFLGPSGCGKTTTLRMVAGFEEITDGELTIAGRRVNDIEPHRRPISMVFQSYALFPHLNVRENVAFGLKLRHESKDKIQELVDSAMESMNISQYAKRAPHELSGGQQQRVALARAIVTEPRVLLFDEPLSNLDAKLRVRMRTEIRRIQSELGITSIFVTHDQEEAMSISDRIVVMRDGRIEQVGNPQEIYQEPANAFVADFIGSSNLLEVDASAVEPGAGDNEVLVPVLGTRMPIRTTGRPWDPSHSWKVLIRPESVRVRHEDEESAGAHDVEARVRGYQYFGDHVRVECEVDGLVLESRMYGHGHHFDAGDACRVSIVAEDSRLIRD